MKAVFKRIISSVLVAAIIIQAAVVYDVPNMTVQAAVGHQHKMCVGSVCGDTSIAGDNTCDHGEDTWTAWSYALSSGKKTYKSNGTYYLSQDVTLDASTNKITIKNGETLTLCLNGHTITMGVKGMAVFTVEDGGTLNLCDCQGGGRLTGATGLSNNGAVTVQGVFNMYGGAITGNEAGTTSSTPGGVYISNYDTSEFNMYGGTISGNKGTEGGGVRCSGGNFNMYAGTISDNEVTGNGSGGGVSFSANGAKKFNMYGGTISGNTAGNAGGGISTNTGEFNMYAGSVSGNKAYSGGGISTPSCIINLFGGEIKNNTATNSYGGGIYAYNSANVNVYGGAVSGNTAKNSGGGIYFNRGTITLDGKVNISGNTRDGGSADNVYLNGSVVTVGESFDTASAVGIHKSSTSTITCSYTEKIAENVSTDISAGFTSDTEDAHIEYTGSELKLMGNHRYPDTYSRDEDKHWKVCTICGNIKDEAEHVYENGECVCGAMAPGAVTLHVNGGSGGTSLSSYTHGTKVELPTDWTKTGYTFAGWYDNAGCAGTAVTEISAAAFGDKEYWAKWTANTYTVTYSGLDGAAVSGNPASYTIESNTITLNNPKKEGYTFTGWSGTGLTGEKNTTVTIPKGSTGNREYTAHWAAAGYNVTLEGNGGSGTPLSTYTHGTKVDLPTDWTKKGYSFAGWYDNESCTGTAVTEISATATGDQEYWAKWTDNIAPVIGALSYSYQLKNLWHWLMGKESLTITVPVTEEGSGAEEITYTVRPDGAAAREETAEIKNGEAEITISADFKGTISIVCTDKAGNTSEGVTVGADSGATGIMIEDHAPKITFEAENAEQVQPGEYKTAPNIDVTVTDDKDNVVSGGIASVSYKIGDGSEKTVDHDYTTGMLVNDSFTIPASEIPADGAVISVTATDNAGNSVTETYTVKVHTHSAKESVPANEATCTEDGNEAYYICACGKWFSDSGCITEVTEQDVVIKAKGHTAVTAPAKEATCTETGLLEGSHCSDCGHVFKAQTVVAALGHEFIETYQQDEKHHWKKCSRCEETQPKTEHIYDNDTDRDCNVCGYERTINPSGELSKDVEKDEKAPDITLSTSKEELADIILTEEEKAQVENGTDIKFVLNVKDAEDIVSSGDKAAVQATLNENTEARGFAVGQYLDISLFKIMGENRSAISETATKLTIVIGVPDSLKSEDSAKPRTFAIIRVHDGVAEILVDLDDDADTITIATDRFSAYAIIYKQAGGGEGIQPTPASPMTPSPTASPMSTPAPTMTPTLIQSPKPDSGDKSSPTPDSSGKPSPTPGTGEDAKPTVTPDVSATPTQSAAPTPSPVSTQNPEPTESAVSTQSPEPTESTAPTQTSEPTQSPVLTQNPVPTQSATPTVTPMLTPTPAPAEEEEMLSDTEKRKWEIHSGLNSAQSGGKLQISWGRVSGADGYSVYVQYCGKDFSAKSLNQVKSGKKTKITVKKVNDKKLDTTKNFKLYVVAWQWKNGKKITIAKTLIVHIAGKDSAEYTNVKNIRLKKTSYTLKKGGTVTLRPKADLYDKNKKQLSAAHTREFRYLSSNQKVAAVTAGGTVRAKGTGSCTVYVFAKNGCKRKIKIKVNQ